MKEEWRTIEEFPNYSVSNLGRVRRDTPGVGTRRGRILKPWSNSGYMAVDFYRNGKRYCKKVHRLVAEAFVPNPTMLPEVNHIDGKKPNNHMINLEWVTRRDNLRHAYKTGLKTNRGERNPFSRITEEKAQAIKMALREDIPLRQVAATFGATLSIVEGISSGRTWKHVCKDIVLFKKTFEGSRNPSCKITEEEVRQIKNLLRERTLSQEKIGSMFGLAQTTVSAIKRGKVWAHIH